MIKIAGLDKAKVVMALYDAARGEDRGLTEEAVQEKLDDGQTYFSSLGNKVLRVDVGGDELDPYEYDQANGVARNEKLRKGMPVGGARKALEGADLIEEDEDDGTPDGSRKLTTPPKGQGMSLPPVATKKADVEEDDEDDDDDEEDKDAADDDEATKVAKEQRRNSKRAMRQQQRALRRKQRVEQERRDRETDPA